MTVRTRFAPSPTGLLHIGGVRTALFCWLYARRHGGTFILRVEDTDRERSTAEAVQVILDGMQWLGLDDDEGPFYQTERMDAVPRSDPAVPARRQGLPLLLLEGRARGDARRADGAQGEAALRRPLPRRAREPRAGVQAGRALQESARRRRGRRRRGHGPIVFENAELDDLIIARSDGKPTYNFCVVVDDIDMRSRT